MTFLQAKHCAMKEAKRTKQATVVCYTSYSKTGNIDESEKFFYVASIHPTLHDPLELFYCWPDGSIVVPKWSAMQELEATDL